MNYGLCLRLEVEGEDEEGFLRDEDMVGRNRGGGGVDLINIHAVNINLPRDETRACKKG